MIEPADAPVPRRLPHPRLWRWAAFDPPLRNRTAPACCRREVRCGICGGMVVGVTSDPVDAILIAWRHAKEIRRARRRDRTVVSR